MMTRTFSRLGLRLVGCLAGLIALGGQASEGPPVEARTDQVEARLLIPVRSVRPGQTLDIGLRQRIAAHWHTYWVNPGDSGMPTRIRWRLPAHAQVGPIEWPVPQRFSLGPAVNYGYADEVVLLSRLQVPTDLRRGESFDIRAEVEWLVCRDVCIPQQVELGSVTACTRQSTRGQRRAGAARPSTHAVAGTQCGTRALAA
jgi:thiol:disulfide interchange protein DsbD